VRKPESTFVAGVHKYFPVLMHREKMNNPYHSGTADWWYSGAQRDLWIEYKYLRATPVKKTLVIPALSELQRLWLAGRYKEGRNVRVVVACPDGATVFTKPIEWNAGIVTSEFKARMVDRRTLAQLIEETVGGPFVEGLDERSTKCERLAVDRHITRDNRRAARGSVPENS